MAYGGNNRAQVFFKQHVWTDGDKIEVKQTSRVPELYTQLLSKEASKSVQFLQPNGAQQDGLHFAFLPIIYELSTCWVSKKFQITSTVFCTTSPTSSGVDMGGLARLFNGYMHVLQSFVYLNLQIKKVKKMDQGAGFHSLLPCSLKLT
ncbi:putative ADP-ribosylation factor GTPase-activating protein AGD9 [Artemisia annua]|uniref:Putative ADP-ribosylation factor GTPase-activating protein AGD9 n=1 Tax=Artemisia annua TaxID=35608 RepID=A0A2U1KNI9_ARTAN|nr:putative ADP-ribosylation factor GTPase-activating protein AGD9 [Artemisia annua]